MMSCEGKHRLHGFAAMAVAVGSVLLSWSTALAASPTLNTVMPRGGQRGSEIELTLAGDRLADAQEILFYQPGLSVKKLAAPTTQQVKMQVSIAADAAIGEHALRVRTASGISELRTFWVGVLPVV